MTDTERIEALVLIHKTHDTLRCQIRDCPICKRYYAILLTRTA